MSMDEIRPSMADLAAASKETGRFVEDQWSFTDMGNGSPNFVFMKYIVATKSLRDRSWPWGGAVEGSRLFPG
jgi:hypothetical protein